MHIKKPNEVHSHIVNRYNHFSEVIGYSGYIFNINYVHDIVSYYDKMPEICRYIDDTWIGWCFEQMGLKVNEVSKQVFFKHIMHRSKTRMFENCLCRSTDRENITKKALLILDKKQ